MNEIRQTARMLRVKDSRNLILSFHAPARGTVLCHRFPRKEILTSALVFTQKMLETVTLVSR